jgi:PAS domain S-box-containing protein
VVLVCARYLGFGPAVAGLLLAGMLPIYTALGDGQAGIGLWFALALGYAVGLFLIWQLNRVRLQVAESSRLAEERLQELDKEKLQREREERYSAQLRAIVESSDDAIISKNLHGVIESWNHGAEQVFGYTAAEAIGKHISLLTPPDRRHEEADILERIRTGGRVQHFETVRVRKDGAHIPVSLTISPIRSAKGEVVGASHIARDISRHKEMEEQMREAQKHESLGILAGGLAHDFNNLLTGVLGNASLVMEEIGPGHSARRRAREIIQATERAALLVKQMLAYAGKGRFVVQRLDLSRQIAEIVPLIRASLGPAVHLDLRLAPNLPLLEADPAQVQQLVMNLAINATEALGESAGRMSIATTSRGSGAGREIVLQVTDTGCGMDEDTRAHIFDPFFTTKFTGRGLGLSAVQGIVRAHRGSIVVESSPGCGSTFTVTLPACEESSAAAAREAQSAMRGVS